MASNRSRLFVIWLTVFIDLVGFGIILPILPYYVQQFGGEKHGIQFGVLMGAYSAMQFLATSLLGRLSDRVGRRPVLLATMLLNIAGYTLFGLAPSYAVLLMARLVSGFGGGNIAVAQAYVADVTSVDDRSKGMGLIGMAYGIGFILGPGIGAVAGHRFGPSAPGFIAAGLSLLNLISAYFILPESLKAEHRVARELWPFRQIAEALAHPELRPLILVWFLAPFAFAGYSVALPLWAGVRLGWHEPELGQYFVLVGLIAAVVQGGLFRILTRHVGDRRLLILGLFGMAVSIAVVPSLDRSVTVYAWSAVLAFSNSLMAPAASGLVSTFAAANEQGTVLGVAQSASALGRLSGPFTMGGIYDGYSPAAAFLVAGAAMFIGWVAGLGVPKTRDA